MLKLTANFKPESVYICKHRGATKIAVESIYCAHDMNGRVRFDFCDASNPRITCKRFDEGSIPFLYRVLSFCCFVAKTDKPRMEYFLFFYREGELERRFLYRLEEEVIESASGTNTTNQIINVRIDMDLWLRMSIESLETFKELVGQAKDSIALDFTPTVQP